MAIPFASGKNFALRFFQDNAPVVIRVKSWEINKDVENAEDGVNGEDRVRYQTITKGFKGTMDAYVEDLKALKTLFNQQDAEDAATAPLDVGLGVLMKPNNGTRDALTLTEMTIGGWRLASGGYTDRATMTIPFSARYCEPSKSL